MERLIILTLERILKEKKLSCRIVETNAKNYFKVVGVWEPHAITTIIHFCESNNLSLGKIADNDYKIFFP